MADYPPFMNAYNLVTRILEKIKDAKTPERFTQDYLAKTLGFTSGSAKVFIGLAKRLNLLQSDGTPTELYHQFRNPDHSRGAMARAMKAGYADLFSRNENADRLERKQLEGLVMQATGLDNGSATLRAICGTFENLKAFADFGSVDTLPAEEEELLEEPSGDGRRELRLGLSYTINLVLPRSNDVAVYNAIFRAIRDNLLER